MTTRLLVMSAGFAARTDVGRRRTQNEDRYLARPPVFAVADGLGGHEAGEVAAGIAITQLDQAANAGGDGTSLADALRAANRAIRDDAQRAPQRAGMATTCTALWLADDVVHIAHIGDSRAYRLRGELLVQLTPDHTFVAEMVRDGVLDAAGASVDDRRHVLTRALGPDRDAAIESLDVPLLPGDRFLICSDGLSGQVADGEIAAVLAREGDAGLAADELVRRANAAGGVDNVTVIVIDPSSMSGLGAPASTGPTETRAPASRALRVGAAAIAIAAIVAVLFVLASLGGSPKSSPSPSLAASIAPSDVSPSPVAPTPRGSGTLGPSETPDVPPPRPIPSSAQPTH